MITAGIKFSNGAVVLTALTSLLAVIEHSKLLPSLHELVGNSEDSPARLTGSAKSISMLDISVIGSLFVGTLIPIILAGLLMLGAGRASLWIRVSALRKSHNKNANRHELFVRGAAQSALIEAIIPGTFAIMIPLAAAFGLGVRSLVGLAVGVLGSGYVLGSVISAAGESWNAAEKIVAKDGKATDVSR